MQLPLRLQFLSTISLLLRVWSWQVRRFPRRTKETAESWPALSISQPQRCMFPLPSLRSRPLSLSLRCLPLRRSPFRCQQQPRNVLLFIYSGPFPLLLASFDFKTAIIRV
jgi:hypothetical protein